jgi:hypothetical protein
MYILLQQALSPEDMGPARCGLCERAFLKETVTANLLLGESRMDAGYLCPECVGYLGCRNPERFPTFGEFVDALERRPEPLFESDEEWARSEEEGVYEELFAMTFIPRRQRS